MANLYTGTLDTNNTYKTLTELTGLTFTSGTTYTIQIQNMAYIREGSTGVGFLINSILPFEYTAGSDDLYIKNTYTPVVINIAS